MTLLEEIKLDPLGIATTDFDEAITALIEESKAQLEAECGITIDLEDLDPKEKALIKLMVDQRWFKKKWEPSIDRLMNHIRDWSLYAEDDE